MDDFPVSDNFADTTTNAVVHIDTWDILVDVARTLTQSKYRDDFRMRGMFVLRSFLHDKIDNALLRGTTDIDSDFRDIEKWEVLVSEIESLLNNNTQISAEYKIVKRRGFKINPKSDSLTLHVTVDNNSSQIKLDMNIRSWKGEQVYQIPEMKFDANLFYAMLCDKISILSQDKLQRRIKDLYYVFLIQSSVDIDMAKFYEVWLQEERVLEEPIALLDPSILPNLKNSFKKYKGFNPKISFDLAYSKVVNFSDTIFQILYGYDSNVNIHWNAERGSWGSGLVKR